MIGRVSADETITLIEVVKRKKVARGKKYKKVREKNGGWIGLENPGFSSLLMIIGEDKTDREKIQHVLFTDNIDNIKIAKIKDDDDFLVDTKKKIKLLVF